MPVSDMIRLGVKLTAQQIADLALQEHRAMRDAMRRGDVALTAMHSDEYNALCALIGGTEHG